MLQTFWEVRVGEANHPGPGLCKDCRESEKGCQNVHWKHRGWEQRRGGHEEGPHESLGAAVNEGKNEASRAQELGGASADVGGGLVRRDAKPKAYKAGVDGESSRPYRQGDVKLIEASVVRVVVGKCPIAKLRATNLVHKPSEEQNGGDWGHGGRDLTEQDVSCAVWTSPLRELATQCSVPLKVPILGDGTGKRSPTHA